MNLKSSKEKKNQVVNVGTFEKSGGDQRKDFGINIA